MHFLILSSEMHVSYPTTHPTPPPLPTVQPHLRPRHAAHHIGELLPSLHNTLCQFLGRCTADNTTGLHLFDLFPPLQRLLKAQSRAAAKEGSVQPLRWPAWMDEGTACFAEAPKTYIGDAVLRGGVVLVRRALVGVGPDCRARMFCNADPL